jgi:hypothetical protein
MLREIVNIIAENARQTTLFNKVYTLAERVRKQAENGYSYKPVHYVSGGNAVNIDYDKTGGMAYFRRNGKVQTSELKNIVQTTSCADDVFYSISYPLKMVCFIPKTKVENDDAFTEDEVALQVISALTNTGLNSHLPKLRAASLISSSYETDPLVVLGNEYSDKIAGMNYKDAYFSIDFILNIEVKSDCLNECLTPYYGN